MHNVSCRPGYATLQACVRFTALSFLIMLHPSADWSFNYLRKARIIAVRGASVYSQRKTCCDICPGGLANRSGSTWFSVNMRQILSTWATVRTSLFVAFQKHGRHTHRHCTRNFFGNLEFEQAGLCSQAPVWP